MINARASGFVPPRPMVGLALCVVSGMVLGAAGFFSAGLLLCASVFSLALAVILFRTPAVRPAVFVCVLLLSAVRFTVGPSTLSAQEMNRMLPRLPLRNVQVMGRIAAPPDDHAYSSGSGGFRTFPMEVEGVQEDDAWMRRRGRIRVKVVNGGEGLTAGQRVQLSGILRKRGFPGNEVIEFDVSRNGRIRVLEEASQFSPFVIGQRLRAAGAATLSSGIETHAGQLAVYKALLLGYRKAVPSETYSHFTKTGTVHIFAISGLHVGMVGLFIVVALKTAGVPRDKWGLWLLPLLLLYVCSTGMKSSALRAWTMAAVYFLAPLLRRKPDVPSAVAVAAILLLWLKPTEILSAGFIFSFTVVAFLVMAFAALPRHWVVGGRWRWIRSYAVSLAATSAVAFIASVPLTALFFGSFSPVALLGNLMVVPLTFCIVLSGWLSMLLPFASDILNHAALVFINALTGSVGWLAGLPGAYRTAAPPSLLAVLFWYGGWVLFFAHARTARQRIRSLGWVALAVVWTVALRVLA